MALGQSIGDQFIFQPQSFGMQPIDQRRSSVSPQDPVVDIGSPMTGLEAKDELVQNYMTDWANLEGFAKHAMKKYNFDITAPDFSDPNQQAMHMKFMKALAKVKAAGNALKRGRENEEMIFKQRATNPNFIQSAQDPMDATRLQGVGSVAATDLTKYAEKAINKNVSTFSEKQAVLREKENTLRELEAMKAALNPNDANYESDLRAIEANQSMVETFRPNYIPQRPTASSDRARSGAKLADIAGVYYQDLVNNNQDVLAQIEGADGVARARIERSEGKRVLTIIPTKKDKGEIKITLDDARDGLPALASFLANHHKEFKGLNPDSLDWREIDMTARENKREEAARESEVKNAISNLVVEAGKRKWNTDNVDEAINTLSSRISPSNPLYTPSDGNILGIEETSTFGGMLGSEITVTFDSPTNKAGTKFTKTYDLSDVTQRNLFEELMSGVVSVNPDTDLGLIDQSVNTATEVNRGLAENEVIRVAPDGRKIVYDSVTKQPLREYVE